MADEALVNLVIGLGADKGDRPARVHFPFPWETGADDKAESRPSATDDELSAARAALNTVSVFN